VKLYHKGQPPHNTNHTRIYKHAHILLSLSHTHYSAHLPEPLHRQAIAKHTSLHVLDGGYVVPHRKHACDAPYDNELEVNAKLSVYIYICMFICTYTALTHTHTHACKYTHTRTNIHIMAKSAVSMGKKARFTRDQLIVRANMGV
jgi:hypothetical protein